MTVASARSCPDEMVGGTTLTHPKLYLKHNFTANIGVKGAMSVKLTDIAYHTAVEILFLL